MKTTQLERTQKAIQAYIQSGTLLATDCVSVPENESVASRLQIYRNAYFLRVIDQLENQYPTLASALGKPAFGKLVHDYITAHPSRYYNIREIGRALPLFMQKIGDFSHVLIEIARVEAALSLVLTADAEDRLTITILQDLPIDDGGNYRFQLIKAHQLLSITPEGGAYFNLALAARADLLIWQRQNKAFYHLLSEKEALIINYFRQGLDFAEVCEKMNQHLCHDEGVPFILQCIQYWIQQEIFTVNRPY